MFSITAIVPTFNRIHSMPRALDSILNQSMPVSEIIVIDDGSTDGTTAILQKHYPQIRIITQTQCGVSAARNVGIKAASNEWLALLDSDDEWLPRKIEKQIESLRESPEYKVCHTEEIWVRNGKRVNPMNKHKKQGGWIYPMCLPLCAMSPSSILLHRSVLDDVGLFDESLPACEDYDLWLRICHRYPALFVEEPCIVKYGGHEDQLSRKYWGMDRFRISALRKILDSGALSQEYREMTLTMLQEKIRVYIAGAEKRGKTDEVMEYRNMLAMYGLDK